MKAKQEAGFSILNSEPRGGLFRELYVNDLKRIRERALKK
jgi:hypothetical protein